MYIEALFMLFWCYRSEAHDSIIHQDNGSKFSENTKVTISNVNKY